MLFNDRVIIYSLRVVVISKCLDTRQKSKTQIFDFKYHEHSYWICKAKQSRRRPKLYTVWFFAGKAFFRKTLEGNDEERNKLGVVTTKFFIYILCPKPYFLWVSVFPYILNRVCSSLSSTASAQEERSKCGFIRSCAAIEKARSFHKPSGIMEKLTVKIQNKNR